MFFSSDGVLDLIKPIVERYRKKFKLFWLRGDTAFASPDIYEYCEANRITFEARLKTDFLAYNLLHLIRRLYLWGEDRRRSIEWIIMRLIKAGARVAYHGRRWYVHVATAFPLSYHYRAVLGWQR